MVLSPPLYVSHQQEFASEAALEDLGPPQGVLGVEMTKILGLQEPWQDQVLRGARGYVSREYGAL